MNGVEWLDMPYIVERLSKRVYIRLDDSKAVRQEETSAMRECYRSVRRVVESNRAVKSASEKHVYIDMTDGDELDKLYFRAGLYTDIGSIDCNGNYTADIETAKNINKILKKLELNKRQRICIELRMRWYGKKAIGTYLGVDVNNIVRTLRQVQKKAKKSDLLRTCGMK